MEKLESTLLIVHDIVDWYNGLPEDYLGINEIIHKRRILATNLFYLTTEVGYLGQQVEDLRRNYEDLYDDLVVQNQENNARWKAEAIAKSSSNNSYSEYNELKAIYTRFKSQEKSIYEVLNAMQQDISVIRKEREANRTM